MVQSDIRLKSEFRSLIQQRRYAILASLSHVYQSTFISEEDDPIIQMSRQYVLDEANRLNFPEGWENIKPCNLKKWYLEKVTL